TSAVCMVITLPTSKGPSIVALRTSSFHVGQPETSVQQFQIEAGDATVSVPACPHDRTSISAEIILTQIICQQIMSAQQQEGIPKYPLTAKTPTRHTNRGPYSSPPIDEGKLAEMAALGRQDLPEVQLTWFVDVASRKRVGDGIIATTEAFVADQKQSSDSFEWFRFDWDDIQQHKDGLTLDAFTLSPLIRSLAKLLPAQSRKSSDA